MATAVASLSPSILSFCTICQCDIDQSTPSVSTAVTPAISQIQGSDSNTTEILPSIHSSRLTLPCGHAFHRCCALKWIHFGHTKCPNCNTQVDRLALKVPIPCVPFGSSETMRIGGEMTKTSGREGEGDVGGEEIEEIKQGQTPLDEIYSDELVSFNLSSSLWSVTSLAVPTTASPTASQRGLSQTGWYNVRLTIVPPVPRKIESIRYVFHPAFSLNALEIVSEPFDLVVKLCTKEVKVVVVVKSNIPQSGKSKHQGSGIKDTESHQFCFVHTVKKETSTRSYIDPFLNTLDTPTLYATIDPPTYFQACLATYNRSPEYYKKTIIPPLRGDRRTKLREYNERGHRQRRSAGGDEGRGRGADPEAAGGIGGLHERDREICTVM